MAKADLKERIIERIIDTKQKNFMNELLAKDYEDVNNSIITYVGTHIGEYVHFNTDFYEASMGQALHLCRIYEDVDARNTEFVNAVILLYSIIMQQVDDELKKSIIGESLWGQAEYGLISIEASESPFCMSFDLVGALELSMEDVSERELREADCRETLDRIVECNRDAIVAWLCSLLFVSIGESNDVAFEIAEDKDEFFPLISSLDLGWKMEDEVENGETEEVEDYEIGEDEDDIICDWRFTLHPRINARKGYLTNALGNYQERYMELQKMLLGALKELAGWIHAKAEEQKTEKRVRGRKQEEAHLKKLVKSLLDDMNGIINEKQPKSDLENHVEILYNIGKVLAVQGKTDESSPREAYRMLVSSYKIIEKELAKRDKYFKYKIKLEQETNFANTFRNSPQAKLLLQGSSLTGSQRELFEEKLGTLLIEFRNKLTVLPKSYNL